MQAHLYNESGKIDRLTVQGHPRFAQDLCDAIVRMPSSGVYRATIVDEQYDRILWDSHTIASEPALGQVMFAGASS